MATADPHALICETGPSCASQPRVLVKALWAPSKTPGLTSWDPRGEFIKKRLGYLTEPGGSGPCQGARHGRGQGRGRLRAVCPGSSLWLLALVCRLAGSAAALPPARWSAQLLSPKMSLHAAPHSANGHLGLGSFLCQSLGSRALPSVPLRTMQCSYWGFT